MKNNVRKHREKLGVNQSEMARDCEVTRQTIHAVEKGIFNPSVLLALKIARRLKVSVDKLFVLDRHEVKV